MRGHPKLKEIVEAKLTRRPAASFRTPVSKATCAACALYIAAREKESVQWILALPAVTHCWGKAKTRAAHTFIRPLTPALDEACEETLASCKIAKRTRSGRTEQERASVHGGSLAIRTVRDRRWSPTERIGCRRARLLGVWARIPRVLM